MSSSERHTRLRILLYAVTMGDPPTGVAVYALELAAALLRRGDVEVGVSFPVAGPSGTQNVPPPPTHRQLWRQFVLPRYLKRGGYAVHHGTEYASVVWTGIPRVVTVHDLSFHNNWRLFGRRFHWHMQALLRTALRAERIIVPSSHVRAQLVTEFGCPPERVRVIAEAPRAGLAPAAEADVAQVRAELGAGDPYLLCVGIGHRGKRTVDVLRAAALLNARGVRFPIVLAGSPAPDVEAALKREANRMGLAEMVRFTGYYHGDMAALYTAAFALAYPSIEEGFGIPRLEAMACDTPVVATAVPAMDEVLSGAAKLVPVRDPVALADAIEGLATTASERREWMARGRERVTGFSWDRAAAETLAIYSEIA